MHSKGSKNTTLGRRLPKFIYDIDKNCIGDRLRTKSSLTEYIFSKKKATFVIFAKPERFTTTMIRGREIEFTAKALRKTKIDRKQCSYNFVIFLRTVKLTSFVLL